MNITPYTPNYLPSPFAKYPDDIFLQTVLDDTQDESTPEARSKYTDGFCNIPTKMKGIEVSTKKFLSALKPSILKGKVLEFFLKRLLPLRRQ